MVKNVLIGCIAASLVLLPACSKTDTASGDKGASAPAAAAATMPKAGLWEMAVSAPGMPKPVATKVCLGEPAPGSNPFAPPPQAGQTCAKNTHAKTASGYTFDMECTMGGMTFASHGEVTGDFSSSYKTDMTTKMSGANIPPAMKETHTTVDAKYLGACPSDMKPGQAKS